MTERTFGSLIQDSISVGAEQDTYTFEGLSGDQLFLRLSPNNSFPVEPVISILRPDGTTLIEEGRSIEFELAPILDTDGTHTLVVVVTILSTVVLVAIASMVVAVMIPSQVVVVLTALFLTLISHFNQKI